MKLTKREYVIMKILWEADEPLIISEIVKREPGSTIFGVQRLIKRLLSKEMVAVDSVVYSHKTLARKFKATVSAEDFEIANMKKIFNSMTERNIPASDIIASMISAIDNDKLVDELDRLGKIIQEKKASLN